MSEHYPRIRRDNSIREGVSLSFYMRRSHEEVAQAVLQALEVYCRAVGPRTLGLYVDDEGEWQTLDTQGWESTRESLLHPLGASVDLAGATDDVSGYAFTYRGQAFDHPSFSAGPDTTSTVSFHLPTEYLEEHGPGRVRELALELATGLPFTSGHAGLSFLLPEALLGITSHIRDDCFRYPGLDIPDSSIAQRMGTQVKGAHWLTFLGQPVLGELEGVAGLRARLHSPDTTVQEMGSERAVVTLGKWPEAGDMERGRTLPAYRELARVLEPWLCEFPYRWDGFTQEDMRRWNRRFLD
jgi:hypothetical protein